MFSVYRMFHILFPTWKCFLLQFYKAFLKIWDQHSKFLCHHRIKEGGGMTVLYHPFGTSCLGFHLETRFFINFCPPLSLPPPPFEFLCTTLTTTKSFIKVKTLIWSTWFFQQMVTFYASFWQSFCKAPTFFSSF